MNDHTIVVMKLAVIETAFYSRQEIEIHYREDDSRWIIRGRIYYFKVDGKRYPLMMQDFDLNATAGISSPVIRIIDPKTRVVLYGKEIGE